MPISVDRLVNMFLYRIYVYIKIYASNVTIIKKSLLKKDQNVFME